MQATVGIDFMAKNMTVNNVNLRLQLWDTAGQERFRSLIPSYLKDATVTFIIFDITSTNKNIKISVVFKISENGYNCATKIKNKNL